MNGEPVLYDPETDTLLVELRPWPAASPAEVNEQVGGEDAEDGLVVHYGPDGLPHAFEIERASQRRDLVARPFRAAVTPGVRRLAAGRTGEGAMVTTRLEDNGTVVEILRDGSEGLLEPQVDWSRIDVTNRGGDRGANRRVRRRDDA
jgi:hypothetical protein